MYVNIYIDLHTRINTHIFANIHVYLGLSSLCIKYCNKYEKSKIQFMSTKKSRFKKLEKIFEIGYNAYIYDSTTNNILSEVILCRRKSGLTISTDYFDC